MYNAFIIYNAAATAAKSLQLCPTLYDPIGSSPPGSPVPGILQARVLEQGAIAFSSNYSVLLKKSPHDFFSCWMVNSLKAGLMFGKGVGEKKTKNK